MALKANGHSPVDRDSGEDLDSSEIDNGLGAGTSQPLPKVPLVPPHWSHQRHESYISIDDEQRGSAPIVLEDNTGEGSEWSSSCWARRVSIDDYVLVSGSLPSVGTFVVWNCKVDTLDVGLELRYQGCSSPNTAPRVDV